MYLFESDGQVMPSVFYSYAQTAAQEFKSIFGKKKFDNPKNWRDIYRILRYLGDNTSLIVDYFAGSGTTGHAVLNLNRSDKGVRKYILVEMAKYYYEVLIPRLKKIVYSIDWSDGKPVSRKGSSHMFKYLKLESYEDTLNNLQLKRAEQQQSLLDTHNELRESYMLSYMLDVESKNSPSLLDIAQFSNPFQYQLKIATDSAGETRPTAVNLLETFNYLLGLKVTHIAEPQRFSAAFKRDDNARLQLDGNLRLDENGPFIFRTVEGTNRKNEKVLVIWRTLTGTPEEDNLVLDHWFNRQAYNTRDREYDWIYVNGDNNLENLRRDEASWKVRLTEAEFKNLMFSSTDI